MRARTCVDQQQLTESTDSKALQFTLNELILNRLSIVDTQMHTIVMYGTTVQTQSHDIWSSTVMIFKDIGLLSIWQTSTECRANMQTSKLTKRSYTLP
jgi:hypothetical protein